MIILRVTNDKGEVYDLTPLEDIDLRLDISAIENTEIGVSFGISSQEFAIAGDNNSNQFFGNLYDLGATPAVALMNSVDCQVLSDGQEVFTGKLYIRDVITNQQGYTIYNTIVVNETIDFKYRIQNLTLNDPKFDFSAYDHNFTAANVTGSWTGSLFSGSIIYPNIHYGNDGTPTCPNYAFAGTNTLAALENTIDNSNSPLRLQDFKPAIKVRDVIDVIFSGSYTSGSTGYQYTSSFFESDYFNSLYLLTTANDALGPANNSPISQSAWVFRSGSVQTILGGTTDFINYNAKSYDNSNNFNLTTDRYTADITGSYTATVRVTYTISSYVPRPNSFVEVNLYKASSPFVVATLVNQQRQYNPFASTGSLLFQNTTDLDAGDILFVNATYADPGGSLLQNLIIHPGELNTFLQVRGPASVLGGNVNMSQQFPDDLKALDLIQAIIEKFNLVVEPVPNRKNLLSIEPYDTWFDSGTIIDWTNKVDRGINFQISSPVIEQPRTIIFSDLDDKDYLNLYTNEVFNKTYGEYVFTSDSNLAEGERKIGKIFAPTPTTNIPNSSAFIIPHLCTRPVNSDSIYKPLAFKPRLLYGIGIQDVESAAAGFTAGSPSGTGSYFLRDETGNVTQQTKWYQVSSLSETPISGAAFDLHFNNNNQGAGAIPPYWSNVSPNNFISGSGDAFTTYWANYINGLYDVDARKLVCNVYLTPSEISGIRLNQKVFIDGAYYRINRINGANLTRRDTIEIEFIKVIARKLTFPRRRITNTITGVSRDVQFQGQNPNGGGIYNDFETGAVVNDFDTISQAGPLDGLRVFPVGVGGTTGSAVWNYSEPTIPILAQTSLGTNTVSADSSKILTLGSQNSVGSSVSTATALGQFNTIESNVTNAFVIGQLNTIGETSQNTQILGGTGNTITGSSNVNMTIMSSTGSTVSNSDYSTMINGQNATILDSDFTVAINSHENEVVVNGSGHAVIGLNNEGAGLDLLNYRNNSNWLGDTYSGGATFTEFSTLQMGVGAVTLTGSNPGQGKHDSVFVLNWSGLSPATSEINLPSSTNSDYKKIKYTFITNGTFDGGTQVKLLGFSGQLINGVSQYTLQNAYESVTLLSSGSGWITTQASSGGSGGIHYGSFYDTTDQTATVANTAYSMSFNTTDLVGGVTLASGSRIYPNSVGVFDIQFSAQLKKNTGGDVKVYIWLAKNGTNVADTNSSVQITGGSGHEVIAAWNFFAKSTSLTDYFELRWGSDTAGTTLDTQTPAVGPGIPSIILTVDQIS
jgi:hypothetical protein